MTRLDRFVDWFCDDGWSTCLIVVFIAAMVFLFCLASGLFFRAVANMPENDFETRARYAEFDGHQYVVVGSSTTSAIAHSPNCPCHTNLMEAVR